MIRDKIIEIEVNIELHYLQFILTIIILTLLSIPAILSAGLKIISKGTGSQDYPRSIGIVYPVIMPIIPIPSNSKVKQL